MAYTKTQWNPGGPPGISAENLNKIEQGIADAHDKVDTALTVVGEIAEELAAHKNDYVSQMAYAVANGTDTYTVSIPGITSLVEGLSVKVKFQNANTGPSTLNINGLGAKEIRKSNGNVLSADNIKAGQICHLVYNGVNFQLLGEGGEYGTAQPQHVLEGYTIGTEEGIKEGTMVNQGAKIITPSTVNQAIPAGYHNGSGYVKGDANLIAANIKKGVSIFGITGTLEPKQIQIGTKAASSYSRYQKFIRADGQETVNLNTVIVTDLTFLPDVILMGYTAGSNNIWYTTVICFVNRTFSFDGSSGQIFMIAADLYDVTGDSVYHIKLDGSIAYVTSTGFRLPCWANGSHEWIAIKL